MQQVDVVRKIVALLQADTRVSPLLKIPPESVLMPFAREHDKHYLMVCLILRAEPSHDLLALLSGHIVGAVRRAGLLNDLQGFEVMFGFDNSGKTERALRLSVLSGALNYAEQIGPDDLQVSHPREGMSCLLYAKPLLPRRMNS